MTSFPDVDPADWPSIQEATRIIDADLAAMPDAPIRLTLRQEGDAWAGAMWQEYPAWVDLAWRPKSGRSPEIHVTERTQADAVRHLAAIVKAVRVGGVDV